jgi:hypothetical protein
MTHTRVDVFIILDMHNQPLENKTVIQEEWSLCIDALWLVHCSEILPDTFVTE